MLLAESLEMGAILEKCMRKCLEGFYHLSIIHDCRCRFTLRDKWTETDDRALPSPQIGGEWSSIEQNFHASSQGVHVKNGSRQRRVSYHCWITYLFISHLPHLADQRDGILKHLLQALLVEVFGAA